MVKANNFDSVNLTSGSQKAEETIDEEVLLVDLIETEEVEQMFSDLIDQDSGIGRTLEKLKTRMADGPDLTGGDIDDNWYQASVVGEEAVGGQTPTPDQNVTRELQRSMGISDVDGEPVHTKEKLDWRDKKRWELDPSSSEDYEEHVRNSLG